jgi:hypothetical protein
MLVSVAVLGALALPAAAQDFNKSFRVSATLSELEVINKKGSVKIVAAEGNQILITARRGPDVANISAVETSAGRIKIEVTGSDPVDFVINVPPHTTLELLCYQCSITVKNVGGQLRASTTEGNILLTGLRSPRVEAHSTSGNVSFSGDILPSGNYTLKSVFGRVEATLPSSADFKLRASSFRGGMDLGGFQMSFNKQTDKVVEGVSGTGRASIYLWTQEGSIRLNRK